MGRNFIWLFGENLAATSNNNSYYFWKQVVRRRDGIDKYIVLEKNAANKETYANFFLLSMIISLSSFEVSKLQLYLLLISLASFNVISDFVNLLKNIVFICVFAIYLPSGLLNISLTNCILHFVLNKLQLLLSRM